MMANCFFAMKGGVWLDKYDCELLFLRGTSMMANCFFAMKGGVWLDKYDCELLFLR